MAIVRDYRALLSDSSWHGFEGRTGAPVILTYSFEARAQSYLGDGGFTGAAVSSFKPYSASEKAMARAALREWAEASGLEFVEVAAGQGEIRFGKIDMALANRPNSAGFAYFPSFYDPAAGETWGLGGDIFTDTRGSVSMHTLLHEVGHAIGLKHSFEGATRLATDLDNHSHTVMSYTGNFAGRLAHLDLAAARHLYGSETPSNGTLISWNWNASTKVLTQTWGAAANTIMGSSQKDRIEGGAGNDQISGHARDDVLSGGSGNDELEGGSGRDTLRGGAGNDKINGGVGIDTADYSSSSRAVVIDLLGFFTAGQFHHTKGSDAGRDTINLVEIIRGGRLGDTISGDAFSNTLHGNGGNDTISGRFGIDKLYGDSGNDVLDGGQGRDQLDGGAGNDTLIGGAGGDTLRGRAGADTFEYASGFDRDRVMDFANNVDEIRLDDSLWFFQALTVEQVIQNYASIVSGDAVLNFGSGDVLTVENVGFLSRLLDDIVIF